LAAVRTSLIGVIWIVAAALLVAGAASLPQFPQPVIPFFCSTAVCPHETSGGTSIGISIGAVLLFFGGGAGVAGVVRLTLHREADASNVSDL
jgi:hypothetical protein